MAGININHAISLHPIPPILHVSHASDDSSSTEHQQARLYNHDGSSSRVNPAPDRKGASTSYEPSKSTAEEHDPHIRRLPSTATAIDSVDLEHTGYQRSSDPYALASARKSTGEIDSIRRRISTKNTLGPLTTSKDAGRARKVQHFYESQNENIERLLKPVAEHVRQAKDDQEANQFQFKLAVNLSFLANVSLAGLQLYGAISSGSLSLFTTMADALFDPLSNVTLILSSRAVKSVDPRRFPSGKARIETAGNIVFCFLMCSVSFILIVMSARELAEGSPSQTNGFHLPSVIAVGVAFVTKLSLFLYCWSLRNTYSQIRILWEDHRNDLLINGFGLLTSVGGSKLRWWIDPMGAIILSALIAVLWLRTAYSEFMLLIGVSADTNMLQLITYTSMTHSPSIIALDTVRAWHSGPRLIVEVDIVMDDSESLRETHDVAEALQMKLESLPEVERCYVHVDYETSHAPEHFLKKEL